MLVVFSGPDSRVVNSPTSGAGGQKVQIPVLAAVGFVLIWPLGEPPAS